MPEHTSKTPHEKKILISNTQDQISPTLTFSPLAEGVKSSNLLHLQRIIGNRAVLRLLNQATNRSPSQSNYVRRKVAFELESVPHQAEIHGDKGQGYKKIQDTKNPIAQGGKLKIASDLGKLEYVTDPLADKAEIDTVFAKIIALNPILGGGYNPITQQRGADDLTWTVPNGYNVAQGIKVYRGPSAYFVPQATLDVPFDKMQAFLNEYQNDSDLIGGKFSQTATYLQSTNVNTYIPGFIASIDDKEKGFLQMILMALRDAGQLPAEAEDPKYGFALMPRNRFSEMYSTLISRPGSNLAAAFAQFKQNIVLERAAANTPKLFPQGYHGDDPNVIEQGPTVDEWLNSVVNPTAMLLPAPAPARTSDLLSPPPGQRTKREGLGAYDLAPGGIPFFELRDFMSAHSKNNSHTIDQIRIKALQLLQFEQYMLNGRVAPAVNSAEGPDSKRPRRSRGVTN